MPSNQCPTKTKNKRLLLFWRIAISLVPSPNAPGTIVVHTQAPKSPYGMPLKDLVCTPYLHGPFGTQRISGHRIWPRTPPNSQRCPLTPWSTLPKVEVQPLTGRRFSIVTPVSLHVDLESHYSRLQWNMDVG